MTNAWKLLYVWKSRSGRSSDAAAVPALDSDLRRTRCPHGGGIRSHRRDDPDPLPRSQYARGNFCRRVSRTEHESVRLTRRSSIDLAASNRDHVDDYAGVASRPRLIRNNQLPDDVVQARERLLERLGSVSLTATREDEALRHLFNSDLQYLDFTPHNSKKSFGVSWEALCNVYLEVFRKSEEIGQITASQECCICLESFCEGDGLIRLPCGHRFHTICLKPWVRTCSYCPYCRRNITCLIRV